MNYKNVAVSYIALVSLVGINVENVSASTDLSLWTAESYVAVNGFGAGVWNVSEDGTSVTQTVNGQPTFFYSPSEAFGTATTGTLRVSSSGGDDDFIGFVLGFQPGDSTNPNADYLLIDWKRGTQSYNFGAPSLSSGGSALRGLAASRVFGIPDADEFWQHANLDGTPETAGLEELARGITLGNSGWAFNTEYEFFFDFGPENLQVWVDGVLQFDLTGNFNNGRFGFYNFSQAAVTYSTFLVEDGNFPSVPVPATVWLMGSALAGLGLTRLPKRKRSERA